MAKRTAGIDQSFEEILQWDEAKDLIQFEHEPGKFKELAEREVKQLSHFNLASYQLSKTMYEKAVKEAELPSFMAGATVIQATSPSVRMQVIGGEPDMHYYWSTPELYKSDLRNGYVAAEGDEVETFASRVGTVHTVGAKGVEEHILMKIPNEIFEARQAPGRKLSRDRAYGTAIEDSMAQQMQNEGGNPITVNENDVVGWHEVEPPVEE